MSNKKEGEKLSLHKQIHHKILHAKTRARITDRDVYLLSKDFFTQLLDLDYEFTHEELIDELKKTYMEKKDLKQAIAFITQMGKMEFTSNEFSHEELKEMLNELHEILNHLVHDEEEIGWFEKIKTKFHKKHEEKAEKIEEIKEEIEIIPEKIETEEESTEATEKDTIKISNEEIIPEMKVEEEIPKINKEVKTTKTPIKKETKPPIEKKLNNKEHIEKLKDCLKKVKKEKNEDKKKGIYQEAVKTYELLDEKTKINYYDNLLKIYYAINNEEMELIKS
jgi:hypothetical protein